MAYIEKSIEIEKPVGAVYEDWTHFEDFPRVLEGLKEMQGLADTRLRWRAEVLTFAPRGAGTRVTLRIDYDANGSGIDDALRAASGRLQRDLELFRTFVEERGEGRGAWRWTLTEREPSHA